MSYIFVDTGQCGNQLGSSILESLYQHVQFDHAEMDAFFRTSYSRGEPRTYARAVCIDTEPKVINDCLSRAKERKSWTFDSKSIVYGHGGAGNNWARGYEMCTGEFLDASLECVRRELEICDRPPSLIITHSVAGGTGSGTGTRLTESLADEFSDVTRLNIAITPYHFGEVVVQHLNTVLCLAKISSASDGVLTFENEVAKQLCIEMKGIERPSMHDINAVIAGNILPILLPKYLHDSNNNDVSRSSHSQPGVPSTLSDDVGDLCSHPGYRFLSVKNVPQTSRRSVAFTYDSWSSLVETLQRMDRAGSSSEKGSGSAQVPFASSRRLSTNVNFSQSSSPTKGESGVASAGCRSLKSILTVRGPDAASGLKSMVDARAAFSSASIPLRRGESTTAPPPSTIFDDRNCQMHYSNRSVNGYQRSAVLLSNSQSILPILQRAGLKGAEMYRAGAYVHQYKSCGLEDEDFVRAFRTVGQVIENYRSL